MLTALPLCYKGIVRALIDFGIFEMLIRLADKMFIVPLVGF
jgi:hypothetical protein